MSCLYRVCDGSQMDCWESFVNNFPLGCPLGEGAYKKVYKVYCQGQSRYEAVSIMDIQSIEDMGMYTYMCKYKISLRYIYICT